MAGIDNYGHFDGDKSGARYRGDAVACSQCLSCEYYFTDKKSVDRPHCCSNGTQTESIAAQKADGKIRYTECKVYEPKKEGEKEKPAKKKGNLCFRIFCCLCKCVCKQLG